MSKKPAAAYVRVSTEEQSEGWSLDGQEQAIRDYAERNGYEIVAVYRDETSGSKEKRPGLDRMLMDARAGRFQAIIALHTSRFFRSVALARRYKDLLRNTLGIEVRFVQQPVVDPNDPYAFMMEGINELFDEYYLYQLSFWTSFGKQTRAQNGMWNGTLPFGYITDEETGKPVPHPKNAEGLRQAFEAYATGRYSDREVAELLNDLGYRTTGNWGERPFTKDTVNRLLQNEFYLGVTKYKGDVYPGEHPPLIDKALFDQCQEVRARRRRKTRSFGQKKRTYVLSGLARCDECGLTFRCHANEHETRYYRHKPGERGFECEVPDRYMRSDLIEPQWSEIVSRIRLPADWRARIEELAGNADEREAIINERAKLQEKLRRVTQLYADLLIEEADYRQQRDRLQTRIASLVPPDSPNVIEAGEMLEQLGTLWAAATLEEQRDLTRMMVKSVFIDVNEARIVAIEAQPQFWFLLNEVCEELGVEVR